MPVDRRLIWALQAFPAAVRIRMEQVMDDEMRRQAASGDFALVEHLCHLRDYDVEGCQQRIRRMLVEEIPALADYEGQRIAIEREYLKQDPLRSAQEFDESRAATVAMLNALSDEQLGRRGRFGAEEITVHDLIRIVAEHDATHLEELDALLAELRVNRSDIPERRPSPRVVVVAVARDDAGRVLLCRMPDNRGVFPGLWSLPGGGVEPGETIAGALAREVREELGVGLMSATPRLFKDLAHDKVSSSGRRVPVYMLFQIYECGLSGTELTLNDEFSEYIWANPTDLADLPMSDVTRDTLASLGIAPERDVSPVDRAEILAAINAFRTAYEGGDLAGLANCYCDDLLKMRQGASTERKSVLLERIAAVFDSYDRALEVDNEEIRVRGDLAVVRGRFLVTLTPRHGGEPVRIARRFLEVWCRHASRWAVCRTMDNMEADELPRG